MGLLDFFRNRFFKRRPQLTAGTAAQTEINNQETIETPTEDLSQSDASNQVHNEYRIDPYLAQQFDYDYLKRYEDINSYNEYCIDFFRQGPNTPMQYDYRQMIQYMEQSGAMNDFLGYYDYILNNNALYHPSDAHGIDHTGRVTFFAEMLTTLDNIPQHQKTLIMLAAVFHDIGREDDKKDQNHGFASVDKINHYHLLDGLNPRDKNIICFAIACHSMEPDQVIDALTRVPPDDIEDCKLVLDYLQDADKLDRVRIANKGWGLDPYRLATPTAKMLVKVAHQNFGNFDRIVNYERNKDKIKAAIDLKYRSFYELRNRGIKITYQDFDNIVNEYNPGTLEILEKEGRILDLLTYDTFQKYGKRENVLASQKPEEGKPDLSFDAIFEDAKKSEMTTPLETTVKEDYMLLYNMKKNHPESYNLFLMCDTDISDREKIGVLSILSMNDIMALRDAGYPYRISDIVALSAGFSIEELRAIFDDKNFDKLAIPEKQSIEEFNRLREQLNKLNINWDDKYVYENFKYINFIAYTYPDVLFSKEFRKYSLPEIYAACTRVESAAERIIYDEYGNEKESYGEKIPRDPESVLKYLQFFKTINAKEFLDDDKQFDVITEVGHETQCLGYPSYINYVTKANKPYEAKTLGEKVYYKRYCIKNVLEDKTLSLEEAKEKLMLAFFDFDVPPKYVPSFERAFLTELYYHKKYFGNTEYEQRNSQLYSSLRDIFNAKSREELEGHIIEASKYYDAYNLEALQRSVKSRLMTLSKNDIVQQLEDTSKMIDNMDSTEVRATDGTIVKAKVLNGHPFTIATTTQLPTCSPHSRYSNTKELKTQSDIVNELINYGIEPVNVCTSISTDYMLARASAVGDRCELVFGYVPRNSQQIGLSANHDLSTKKALNKNNQPIRTSQKPTLYLKVEDSVNSQVESHGETVMNEYPRYIFCYDEINPLAVEKKKQLDELYRERNIQPPVEIVLIPAKEIYIPRIKGNIRREHENILRDCKNGSFTLEDFDKYITNPEGNVVTRTIQAANSVTIRKGILHQEDFISEIYTSLADVLEKKKKKVPPDRMEDFKKVVQLAIDRGDPNTELGKCFYNYNYSEKVPIERYRAILGEETERGQSFFDART